MPIAVGQPAPDFTLKDQSQKEIKLSDFAGKRNVVLIFYPLDFSPHLHERARLLRQRFEAI